MGNNPCKQAQGDKSQGKTRVEITVEDIESFKATIEGLQRNTTAMIITSNAHSERITKLEEELLSLRQSNTEKGVTLQLQSGVLSGILKEL